MLVVAEKHISGLMTPEAAFTAIEAVFAAMARRQARNFPVVREIHNTKERPGRIAPQT